MEISDELAALEYDFRRMLIVELERVIRSGDEKFFAHDQPQYRKGSPTPRKLADEIIELRLKMKPAPDTRCDAASYLGYCIRWSYSPQSKSASSALARQLLEQIQNEKDD